MKATELMIGDWVEYRTYNNTTHKCHITLVDKGAYYGNCSPIPLTEEILKINDIDEEILSYEFYDGYHFKLTNGKKSVVEVGAIWYVHQLQQALRLCGLNEIADGFKVK